MLLAMSHKTTVALGFVAYVGTRIMDINLPGNDVGGHDHHSRVYTLSVTKADSDRHAKDKANIPDSHKLEVPEVEVPVADTEKVDELVRQEIIPEILGKIIGVSGGVLVINQGSREGVQKGYMFNISRGGQFITKAKVMEVYAKRSVCYVDEIFNQKDDLGQIISVAKHDNVNTK